MIWILWHIFILFEAGIHWFLIEICQLNPTPDKFSWESIITVLFRLTGCFIIFRITFMDIYSLEFLMYVLGAFFSHVLWFPVILNMIRGKPVYYLGDAGFDKFLKWATHDSFYIRVVWLLILSSGFIYGFYNTHLL